MDKTEISRGFGSSSNTAKLEGEFKLLKRGKSARDQEREKLIPKVKEIHMTFRKTYGSRRIAKELESRGTRCG